MKKLVFLLICLAGLSSNSVLSSYLQISESPLVRIGIIQHFGKNPNSDILTIQSTDELEIIYPKSPDQLDFQESLKQNTKSFQLKVSLFPNPENSPISSKVIAGAYRTYETASYWADNLKEKFPYAQWQVVYPGPWQIWTESDKPQQLMQDLYAENFSSAWIQQKPKMSKVLTWIEKKPEEHYSFHRRKLLIKSPQNQPIKINNKTYLGTIEVSPDSFGTYSVINEISLEEYLRGVVPFEIGASSPKAALETQAILARTYTLANLQRFLPENYNLCATQDCQVYGGLGSVNKNIDEAIKNTRNIVLKDKFGQIAQVFYYSTDGGFSANYSDIWQGDKIGLNGINTCSNLPDQFDLSKEEEAHLFLTSPEAKTWGCYDAVSPAFRWENRIKATELNDKMKKAREKWKFAWPEFNQILDLKVQKRSNTGRVLELLVLTDKGSFIIEKDEVRAALGGLKSSFFIIDKITDNSQNITFAIKGGGFGHGVGLSQFGARTLASQGLPFESIIKIYFPDYRLSQI